MRLENEQKRLVYGLAAGVAVGAIVALGLHYWFGANLFSLFLVGTTVLFSTLWTRGGRTLWNQLSPRRRILALIAAGAAIFVLVAVTERHQPQPLMLASLGTGAAGLLLVLYLLFSCAMDALWRRWLRRP